MKFFTRRLISAAVVCAIFVWVSDANARDRTTPTVLKATAVQAGSTSSGHPTGRLIVQRAANFGSDLFIRLSIDGKRVANIPRNQHYGGVLVAGRHVVTALALPNTQARRPTSIAVTIKPGKVYIFTAAWDGDRLILRPSDYYSPTTRANR